MSSAEERRPEVVPVVEVLSVEDVEARRRDLIESSGMSERELYERADVYALTLAQMDVVRKLRSLDYLAGR